MNTEPILRYRQAMILSLCEELVDGVLNSFLADGYLALPQLEHDINEALTRHLINATPLRGYEDWMQEHEAA